MQKYRKDLGVAQLVVLQLLLVPQHLVQDLVAGGPAVNLQSFWILSQTEMVFKKSILQATHCNGFRNKRSSQSNLVRGTNPTDQEPEPVNKVLESEPDRKCCLILLLSTAEHKRCEERHNKKNSFSDISILIWLKQMKKSDNIYTQ